MHGNKRIVFVLLPIMALSGCTRQISNKVSAEEYALYSAWTANHFAKNPPERLYFSSRTAVFDPTESPCKAVLLRDGVSWPLMKELHALGDAEYRLDFDRPGNLQIPWSYKEVAVAPDLSPGSFHLIAFSRIAFNRGHTDALFAFFDACASGECGHGGYVQAKKMKDEWIFHGLGCAIWA